MKFPKYFDSFYFIILSILIFFWIFYCSHSLLELAVTLCLRTSAMNESRHPWTDILSYCTLIFVHCIEYIESVFTVIRREYKTSAADGMINSKSKRDDAVPSTWLDSLLLLHESYEKKCTWFSFAQDSRDWFHCSVWN